MTTFEHFDDSELDTFFDTESQKELDQLRRESEHAIVNDRVWSAIEALNMDIAISRNPSAHKDDFNALMSEVAEVIDILPPNDTPNYSKQDHIRSLADAIWSEQDARIEQMAIALDMQLHGNISPTEKATMKKKIMARIMISGNNQEQWLALADTVLDGEALDLNNPDDYEMITEAMEIVANIENTLEVRLYDSILEALGVPDLNQDIPENYDLNEVKRLTLVARDISETTFTKIEATQQPERYSAIHEIVRSHGLQDEINLPLLFELVDSYAEQKIAQS